MCFSVPGWKIKAQRGKAAEDAACQWSRRANTLCDDPICAFPSLSSTVLYLCGFRQHCGITYPSLGHLPLWQPSWEASHTQVTIVLVGRSRSVEPPCVGKAPTDRPWVGRELSRLWTGHRVQARSCCGDAEGSEHGKRVQWWPSHKLEPQGW